MNDHQVAVSKQDGVHVAHCCRLHGCKYGDVGCPVVLGRLDQSGPCDICGEYYNIWDMNTVRGMIAGSIPVCSKCGNPLDSTPPVHALAHEPTDLQLRERNAILVSALRFYADESNWSGQWSGARGVAPNAVTIGEGEHMVILGAAIAERGAIARRALEGQG